MDNQKVAKELVALARELTSATKSPFEVALKKAIASEIKKAKKDGTTSMSLENLMQVVKSPKTSLEGAPKGTNARYFYKDLFKEVAKDFRSFVKVASSNRTARVKWDKNSFTDSDFAAILNRSAYKMVPFHELSRSDQSTARRAYPHKSVGAKYDFLDEHYYYPVKKDGSLGRGQRVLAVPYKRIMDDNYMSGLGYIVNQDWKGASSDLTARELSADDGEEVLEPYKKKAYMALRELFRQAQAGYGAGMGIGVVAEVLNEAIPSRFVKFLPSALKS